MPGRATVKEESRSHSYHEEVCDEAVLANSTEPDAHFDGFLDIHPNPADMALCQMEDRPHRIPSRAPDDLLGTGGIGVGVLLAVLAIGWAYDVSLGLWREHLTIVQERNPFTTYKINVPFGMILAQTNAILRRMDPEDEEIQRHCDFVDRWLEWNSKQEIWARTVSSLHNIVGEDDPFFFNLSEEARAELVKSSEDIQDF